MPETSQDAYESLHPGKQPVSAAELRIRSNSIGKNKQHPATSVDGADTIDPNLLWPTDRRRPRESRVSVSELDSCITAPEMNYGYKRESSHR